MPTRSNRPIASRRAAAGAMPSAPVPSMPSAPVSSGPRHSGPVPSLPSAPVPSGATSARGRTGAPVRERRPRQEDEHFSTGPIPVVRPQDLDASPKESALAWLRFVGELVIALAAGVGVYFAATVLWEMLPHVAVLLAPLAVTGLGTGVRVWRQRQGREQMSARLLAILVFAGTLLTIAPAAGLLAGS